jgi:hypothetical protein
MNTIPNRDHDVINWSVTVMITIGFWLSAITVIDFVIIPSLSTAGMMLQSGFASAGYLLFEVFNHIEIVCAAVILTGILSLDYLTHKLNSWSLVLAISLLVVTLVDTYLLTPQMSGLGLSLNLFDPNSIMSPEMIHLHQGYWILDLVKIFGCVFMLRHVYDQEKLSN